jgi:hypothetical protein
MMCEPVTTISSTLAGAVCAKANAGKATRAALESSAKFQ